MNFSTEPYLQQVSRWPRAGRVIVAQYDKECVIVYQAYGPEIGNFAAAHGHFEPGFGLSRMSWIKPNFLWMMYRSGWGQKERQDVVLAVHLRRDSFRQILKEAAHSSYEPLVYPSYKAWKHAVKNSDVRLQWDPDHDPQGNKLNRRAIQLGLRGPTLGRYAREWIVEITDITDFVAEQRRNVRKDRLCDLITPREEVYPVSDAQVAAKLGVS